MAINENYIPPAVLNIGDRLTSNIQLQETEKLALILRLEKIVEYCEKILKTTTSKR
jgi:hypothetical protein